MAKKKKKDLKKKAPASTPALTRDLADESAVADRDEATIEESNSAEKSAEKATKKTKKHSVNRWRIGALSLLQLFLISIILLCINYLSLHHSKRWDLSRDADYSLSSSTQNYMASDALQKREGPVKFIMAYRRTSPFYERVRALAKQYASQSRGKIELTLVDPMRDSDKMEEISAAYGISLIRDLILIDARSDESPVTTETDDRVKILNPHIKLVTAEHMLSFEIVANERKITGFRGEDMLTARLVESIEGQPKRMALLADKSRIGRRDNNPARKTLEDLLRYQNITLDEIQLTGTDTIPENVDGLLIVAPQYDFSEEEIAVLDAYWNRPRSAIMVLVGDQKVPPRLRAFMRKQGVTPRNDRVIGRSRKGWVTQAQATFTEGISFTEGLARQVTEFGGSSSSLEVRENANDLLNRRIIPRALLQVEAGFWGESEFGKGESSFDERTDHAAPLYLAASVTRGAENDDRYAAESSRMIIISNTDFLSPAHHRAENLDFLSSSANWLIGRESLSGITPRQISTYKLPLLQAQASFINRCNLIFMPLILLVLAGFIWSSRRA